MPGGLDPRGPVAEEIAKLWWYLFWVGVAVFALFAAVLVLAMLKRRRGGEGALPDARGAPVPEESGRYVRRWIVALGVLMTSVVLVAVLAVTIVSMNRVPHEATAGALRLELVAKQWYWEVGYPDHGITTRNVVRIPVGRQVELLISSSDVIHSFWVPALAGKMDAVPGRTNTLVLQADVPGTYRGQCAEFCGLKHAEMRVTVVAMQADAFDAWTERAG